MCGICCRRLFLFCHAAVSAAATAISRFERPHLQIFAVPVLCRLPVSVTCAVLVVATIADVAFAAVEEWDLAALIAMDSDVQRG